MLRPIAASLTALALLPAASEAATVRADRAATGACTPSAANAATTRLVPEGTGVATVGVAAAQGDWDLTVLDARTGERVAAAASSAGDEWTYALVREGRALTAVACRRPGASPSAEVTLRTLAMPDADRAPAALVRVEVADEIAMRRLEATGLDVTHNHDHEAGTADVVVYGPGDRLALLRAGFPVVKTLIADLRLHDLQQLREDERVAGRSVLPSGRTTYRTLADYDADMKKVVADHPAIARSVSIGKTLENRSIDAVELAEDVHAEGDGRPTFLVLGVHHAREWPSGEMPMEFAIDIAKRHAAGDPRVVALLKRVRILAVPVVNRDGFEVSRTAGGLGPLDDSSLFTIGFSASDALAYKRKNCRALVAQAQAAPCITRPAVQGVDLNRNYGQFFGGVGSSTDPTSQGHRGPAPYSEPESEAIHRLSSTRTIPVLVSHHTFTSAGTWLRQPGFCQTRSCDLERDVVEDEAPMKDLGDAMGEASGWQSQLGWAIGEITGATEDWNYFTQGTLGYTPEQRAGNFHPAYATAVVREYDGTGPGANGGVAESLLRAAETAAAPASHAVLEVAGPRGRELRLTKSFKTPTSLAGVQVDDQLDFRAKIPADGKLEWHVNQSSRPSCEGLPNCAVPKGTIESYTLECINGDKVAERREVTIARGQRVRIGVGC